MEQRDEGVGGAGTPSRTTLPPASEPYAAPDDGGRAPVVLDEFMVETVTEPVVEPELPTPSRKWDRLGLALVFLVIYAILFILYRPQLLFALTTTSGGDMGAHHYPAKFMIEDLVPRLRLTGWTSQWYAGMPMFTFYLPLPFLLIALLNFVLPYTIAFKLATVAGVFALPVVAYAFGRLFRLRKPFPALAAVFALLFLLMESYSIYGGNILSTLAGEFGYSISFALAFLFLGTLYRGMERPRLDAYFALNALILMCVVLSHIVTVIALVLIAPSLLLIHRRGKALLYLMGVFFLGFLLSAFWGIPFVDKLQWTAHMSWDQLRAFKDLLPPEIRPIAALGVLGMAYAVAKREIRMLPLLWIVVMVTGAFYLLPDGRLWNARLLPFMFFAIHLWAAYGAAWLLRPFVVVAQDLLSLERPVAERAYAPLLALILGVTAIVGSTTAMGWITWNYSGYERKAPWPQYKQINDFIGSLPNGRVMWEHSPSLDKFGTPRIIELTPYWTSQPAMEGTLMESAFTAPYHFINQAELSKEPSKAIIGVDYPAQRNVADGITHLQFMNVRYLVTVSPEVTGEVASDPRARLLKKIDVVSIFQISGDEGYVEVMKNEPVRVKTADWRTTIVPWYRNLSDLSVPVLWDRGQPGLSAFPSIDPSQVTQPPVEPINTQGQVLSQTVDGDRIQFETTAIGQPHWIKVSYFPNWHVKGADGPYVASPSFMMVIPRERVVTLTYGRTASNTIGQLLTGAGWLAIVALLVLGVREMETQAKRVAGRRHLTGCTLAARATAVARSTSVEKVMPVPWAFQPMRTTLPISMRRALWPPTVTASPLGRSAG